MYYKFGQVCVTNCSSFFYYKLGQTLLQIGEASLLQIGAIVVTNWGSYYKLGQPLLQNRTAITNWGKMYYKLWQLLQIRAIITNWSITVMLDIQDYIKEKERQLHKIQHHKPLPNVPTKVNNETIHNVLTRLKKRKSATKKYC